MPQIPHSPALKLGSSNCMTVATNTPLFTLPVKKEYSSIEPCYSSADVPLPTSIPFMVDYSFQPGLHTCFELVKFQSVLILLCIKWDVVAVGLSTFVWNQSQHSACPWVKGHSHPPWVVALHINFVRCMLQVYVSASSAAFTLLRV
ncbi:hypothetical protein SO802_030438 [Lithocarpus litseifolius]|uniref:Uncharacterized protein n=1 Tax=Lithocarpus litseifolius TaxID=425828 RepID=A0AAW2BJW7_9ROSI